MSGPSEKIWPDLVSVIIPSYNHGNYLPEAIESVHTQKGINTEIIVVDDGSTDDTRLVVQRFPFVKYIYQSNKGLSAARNTGIDHSTGTYLVFLDADDWLLEDALSINLNYFKNENAFAFVSGAYKYVFEKIGKTIDIFKEVTANHYQQFLVCNYIGMHGAVMYQRWALDTFRFDTSLKASEDYDIFLKLARKFPVFHHTQPIAAYRIHGSNMSADIPMMLTYTLEVLKRQEPFLQNESERRLLHKGIQGWKKWYCSELFKKLYPQPLFTDTNSHAEIAMLWKHNKTLLLKYFLIYQYKLAKWTVKKIAPNFMFRQLHKAGLYPNFTPAPGKVNKGDFDRTAPFSKEFGYDRGGPIDRYYIEDFLSQHASAIKGRVLEIGDNAYTLRFGGSKVLKSDVLNLTETPDSTFVGDLSRAPHLPQDTFDCIILTQTLHLIYDYKAALQTCYRVLKPGGTLLLTVPGISQIDHDEWEKYWFWSFTTRSIEKILSDVFVKEPAMVKSYGNVLAASAFLFGLGVPELNRHQLDYLDTHYQLIISAAVHKPE